MIPGRCWLRHVRGLAACFALAVELVISTHACSQSQTSASVAPIVAALKARDFAAALKLSHAALAAHPADYRVWTLQGMATAGAGNLPQALSAYKHALRLAPKFLPALEGAAQTEFQLRRPGVRDTLQKILSQRPADPPTHALLGILDARANNCGSAVDHFAKAQPVLAQQPEAESDDALCLASLGRDDEAAQVFATILARDPTKTDARYNLALAQWKAHQPKDALETLRPVTDSQPPDSGMLVLAAEVAEDNGDTAQAVATLRKALLADPKCLDAYLQFATLSYDHASPQVGVDMLNAGLTQLPNEPRLYLVRGILLTQLGEFSHAADDFETASHIDPRLQFLGVAQGLVSSQQHQSAQALAQFRAAAKSHPNEAFAHYLLAEALHGDGIRPGTVQYKEELDAALNAVKLDPGLVAAHDLLSSIYLESGKTQSSVEQSKVALNIDPNDQQAVYHLIVALRGTDQKDQIPELLKRLVALRRTSNGQGKNEKRFRLYEGSPQSGSPTP